MSFTRRLSEHLRLHSRRRGSASRPAHQRRTRPAQRSFRPCVEGLEQRWVPSTLRVNHDFNIHSALDATSQHGTLSWAVANAQNGDIILLTADAARNGIVLPQGELILTQQNLTIETEAGQP